MAERKKSTKKAAIVPAPEPEAKTEARAAFPAPPAPQAAEPQRPQVIGPGVMKRPKRDPSAPEQVGGQDLTYKPSEQVFRRRG